MKTLQVGLLAACGLLCGAACGGAAEGGTDSNAAGASSGNQTAGMANQPANNQPHGGGGAAGSATAGSAAGAGMGGANAPASFCEDLCFLLPGYGELMTACEADAVCASCKSADFDPMRQPGPDCASNAPYLAIDAYICQKCTFANSCHVCQLGAPIEGSGGDTAAGGESAAGSKSL